MSKFTGTFYQGLDGNPRNPDFAEVYAREELRTELIAELIRQLDAVREEQGITKADLAKALHQQPANVRRFFTAEGQNPTMASFLDLALALGYRLKLEPLA